MEFWAGILIGFVLSVLLTAGFWGLTTKILTPKLEAYDPRGQVGGPLKLAESRRHDGVWTYQFNVENSGHRHAVDIEFSCTLFSTGWASDEATRIATISLPVTTGRIGIMPAHRSRRNRKHPLTFLGPRIVTFNTKITEFQARKLAPERQLEARAGKIRLSDLMTLGDNSLVSVTIYAYDNFSGSRNVFTEAIARVEDIRAAAVP
jgi:hypothetical protein